MTEGRSPHERAAAGLRTVLGHDEPRPGQVEAIAAVLEGRDTLAVLPTGSGKSAVYQVAAALIDGPTVVVSPLIALQHDQARSISDTDAGEAAAVNSTLSASERDAVLDAVAAGEVEFVLVAPEQLSNEATVERLRAAQPSLLVVDEAHCVSSWGHDFRPDYLQLGRVVAALGHPCLLALTATAAPPVRDEIVEVLGMDDPAMVVESFDRPELHLAVDRFAEAEDKTRALVERVLATTPPGLVYVATQAQTEELAARLVERGCRAEPYHAGRTVAERQAAHEGFLDGTIDVVVATVAFGMGIDKPDVRYVFHHDIPGSIDAYYQEVGRAGRDGRPAEAVLFWRAEDLGLRTFFATSGLDEEALAAIVATITGGPGPMALDALEEATGLSRRRLLRALHQLGEAGAVSIELDGRIGVGPEPIATAMADVERRQEARRQVERSRLEMMRAYAEADGCRRTLLLGYFGEAHEPPCSSCDVCDAGRAAPAATLHAGLAAGQSVHHQEWGAGTVVALEGEDAVRVLFESVGYKLLSLQVVLERGLLTVEADPPAA